MPFDRKLYPANWYTEIRPAILERAGHRCEQCGVGNYSVGYRDENGYFTLWGIAVTYKDARELADAFDSNDGAQPKALVIVLTIAHMDNPDPADCRPENLKALCQRCHLRHDGKLHAQNAYKTRRKGLAIKDLFDEVPA